MAEPCMCGEKRSLAVCSRGSGIRIFFRLGVGVGDSCPDRLKCKGNKSIAEKVIIIKILTTTYPKAIIYPVLARNKIT